MGVVKNKLMPKKRKLSELLGLDFGGEVLKAVRLKGGKQQLSLEAVELIPFDESSLEPLSLPASLSSNYAAVSCSADRAVLRVVSAVLKGDALDMDEQALRESLNVDDSFRVSSEIISRARGKQESFVLGVAVPNKDIAHLLRYFETGAPAVHSVEISFLAALNSYFLLQPDQAQEGVYCFLELGASGSSFAFVSEGDVMLVGRSHVGGNDIKKRIQTSLSLDEELAQDLLFDKAVDISAPVQEVLSSFLRQLAISRDFMGRRTDSNVSKIILSGGMCASPYVVAAFSELFGLTVQLWDPFECLEIPVPLSLDLVAHRYRFAAAIGAAAGGLMAQ